MDKKVFSISLWVNVIADDYEEASDVAQSLQEMFAESDFLVGSTGITDIEELQP